MDTRIIEIKDLVFGYPGGSRVFDGFGFRLDKGQRVGLVGPNGSGKTTLLHIIMGLLRPERGEVVAFGRTRNTEEDFFEVRKRIGLVFQDPDDQLFCPTVEEDIAFGPLNLGRTHEQAGQAVTRSARALGIEGLLKRLTHRLSEGEKKLVCLATVIAMDPECLLLDEPAAGLDRESSRLLAGYLREHGRTYVLSSHDPEFLRSTTDTVLALPQIR